MVVWTDYIDEHFDLIDRSTRRKNNFYGAYNSLLRYLFPSTDGYLLFPQFRRDTGPRLVDYYTISYVVLKNTTPIFFVEIKSLVALELDRARAAADDQMRTMCLGFSSDRLPQSKLIGISAMGTRFAAYEYTTSDHRIDPPRGGDGPPPKERWSDDIMEDLGEAKFRALVNEAKEMASAIGGVCEHYFLLYSCPFTD
jgi:hypothetical protein